ncbi:SdiA-regulated/phytase-like domain-containing protein [Adhaeribacter soli]|uniref:WD40 repeat domain-containing protein n=1 Tax=Adhaeribacter soli TaxID=2607655 RepID=A0A5N1IU10_9BACT|nr:hypothetical protein [Adhaeribacter soli]KAA9333584.1 hypothetical protein F0P94_10030 [Adhaeribacter soli]
MKFWKALVVLLVVSLPFIYGYNIYSKGSWKLAQQVTHLGNLPSEVTESSGLAEADEPGTFFTHNDHGAGGTPPVLFKVNSSGKLLKKYTVSGATNQDWEDLTNDTNGNIYIADTGNNNGKRTDLKIYKAPASNPSQAQVISFTYSDKPEPGESKKGKKGKKKPAQSFDCEAIFWHNGKLYLVTKDRSKSGEARLYELPDTPGNYTASLVSTQPMKEQVTAADLSPDGSRLVLMSVGKLHVFNVSGNNFLSGNPKEISLGNVGQTEGMVFTDNNTIVFTNEEGQLFKYSF